MDMCSVLTAATVIDGNTHVLMFECICCTARYFAAIMERLSELQTRAALELIDQSRQSIDARLPNSKGKKSSANTSTNDKLGPLSNALQDLANVLQERDDLCTALAGMQQTVAKLFVQLVRTMHKMHIAVLVRAGAL
jgi:hypothetical protein